MRLVSVFIAAALLSACDSRDDTPPPPSQSSVAWSPSASALPVVPAAPSPRRRVRKTDGAVMLLVPEGPFVRGSGPKEGQQDERPQRRVHLSSFFIDRLEVTTARYRRCVEAGACTLPAAEHHCNLHVGGREEHPVNCVDWSQADAYCRWAGGRLPTEAEWEKAARGDDGDTYPWGPTAPSCVVAVRYGDKLKHACGKFGTWPVGSKPFGKSPYGALDMAGNVWEWVADYYSAGAYASAPDRDPRGPSAGRFRILRGGGWGNDGEGALRAARRFKFSPENRTPGTGFRCAM